MFCSSEDHSPVVTYESGAMFIPRCPECGKFVKSDESIVTNIDGLPHSEATNATCKTHGRVKMSFIGFE